ncbi:hypothetical protein [Streptomyces aureoversilis]|uniref:Uncharacterized protein n=1 Tax=Streptomyces aureoversilis TaxID=67277 RepID=A0ABW0A446_9ACTN
MRHRIPKSLSAPAAALTLSLVVPGSASAASGRLVLNGRVFTNPSGCHRNLNAPLSVQNRTGAVAFVHTSPDCTGPGQSVPPDGTFAASSGHSVRI